MSKRFSYVCQYLIESGKSSQRIAEQDRSQTPVQCGVTSKPIAPRARCYVTYVMNGNMLGLAAEAASALKLNNGVVDGVVLVGSWLVDVVVGIGGGGMDGNSLDVGTSCNNDDDDIRRRHPAGPSFWV
jgi:hypothetical protein